MGFLCMCHCVLYVCVVAIECLQFAQLCSLVHCAPENKTIGTIPWTMVYNLLIPANATSELRVLLIMRKKQLSRYPRYVSCPIVDEEIERDRHYVSPIGLLPSTGIFVTEKLPPLGIMRPELGVPLNYS